jgi:hypothetical protein
MKWIGQHIWDFISRFRSDVYIEDDANLNITTTKSPAIDIDIDEDVFNADILRWLMKIYYDKSHALPDGTANINTGLQIQLQDTATNSASSSSALYGATIVLNHTSAQGTVAKTGLTISTGGESDTSATYGIITNIADGGTDIRINSSATTSDHCTIKTGANGATTIETTDHNGTSGHFEIAANGDITLDADGQIKLEPGTSVLWDSLALTGIQASGETFADNDTSLMTSAAIDDKINTKYAYTYMTWSASAIPTRDAHNDPEWMLPNTQKGIYHEDWNNDSDVTATSVGTTTYAFSRYHAANSLIIPHAGVLVGFHAIGRNHDSDLTFKAGLFHADNGSGNEGADGSAGEGIDYGNTGVTNEYTLRCVATAAETEASGGTDGTTSHNFKGPCKLISNTADLTVQAGDALLPAIMGNSSNSTDEIYVTMTIILKIPLTT